MRRSNVDTAPDGLWSQPLAVDPAQTRLAKEFEKQADDAFAYEKAHRKPAGDAKTIPGSATSTGPGSDRSRSSSSSRPPPVPSTSAASARIVSLDDEWARKSR